MCLTRLQIIGWADTLHAEVYALGLTHWFLKLSCCHAVIRHYCMPLWRGQGGEYHAKQAVSTDRVAG